MTKLSRPSASTIFIGIGLTILALQFLWFFYVNFLLADNFDILQIKAEEEVYFQAVLGSIKDNLLHYRWLSALSNTSFGYGNLYWQLNEVLVFPFQVLGMDNAVIILPRMFTLFCHALCFLMFFLLCKRSGGDTKHTVLAMLLIATSAETLEFINFFHNSTLLALLVILPCTLAFTAKKRSHILFAAALVGVGVGVKVTNLVYVPLFFLFANKDLKLRWREIFKFEVFKENFSWLMTIAALAFLALSPTILFSFWNTLPVERAWEEILFTIKLNSQPRPMQEGIWPQFHAAVFEYHIQWPFYIVAAIGGLILLLRKRPAVLSDILAPMSFMVALLLMTILAFKVNTGSYVLSTYMIPMLFILPYVLVDFGKKHAITAYLFFAISISATLYMNSETLKWKFFLTYNKAHDPGYLRQTKRNEVFKSLNLVSNEDYIIKDSRVIFPKNLVQNALHVELMTDMMPPIDLKYDVYVMSKKSWIWKDECDSHAEFKAFVGRPLCEQLKNIIMANPPYVKIYEDEDALIIRKVASVKPADTIFEDPE